MISPFVKQLKQLQRKPRKNLRLQQDLSLRPIGTSEFFLGFLCNCLSCFTTAKISFTSNMYSINLSGTFSGAYLVHTSRVQSHDRCMSQSIKHSAHGLLGVCVLRFKQFFHESFIEHCTYNVMHHWKARKNILLSVHYIL